MTGRDHTGTRELGAERQCVAVETHQIVHEQEQASDPRGELARREGEVMHIGHRFGIGSHADRSLFVTPTRQGCKALQGENLAHRGRTQRRALLLESLADLVDRVVPLAQRHDLLVGTALLGLLAGPGASGCEEFRQFPAAKGVAQHAECARRVAEALCRLCRRQFLHEEGAQGLVLALAGRRRFREEAATFC